MPIYNKPSAALVYDLINQANPTPAVLPVALSSANMTLSNPTPTTVPGRPDLNTSVIGIAVAGGSYIGRKSLNYRRLDLSNLLRGITVQIKKYSSNQGSVNSVVFTVYNLLQAINQQYGLNLTQDDVVDANIVRGNVQENGYYTASVTVATKPGSLGYIGQFTLKWVGDAQDIANMISVTELPGRTFPGGNDFSVPGRLPIVNNTFYAEDFSQFIANHIAGGGTFWEGYPNAFVANSYVTFGFINVLFGYINQTHGYSWPVDWQYRAATITKWTVNAADLSTTAGKAAVPNANNQYYNRVLEITLDAESAALLGVQGTLYIHFNV